VLAAALSTVAAAAPRLEDAHGVESGFQGFAFTSCRRPGHQALRLDHLAKRMGAVDIAVLLIAFGYLNG
jgi:hypothetical protein